MNWKRVVWVYFAGLCVYSVVAPVCAVAAEPPVKEDRAAITPAENLLGLYKKWISPTLGGNCPMYPSCSQYSRQTVEKHGLIRGWIMTCDRLLRCGRDETSLAPKIIINGRIRSHDPLEENDGWWNKQD